MQCRRIFLSVTKAKLIEATSNAQDMMYAKSLLESIELQVQLPMILEMDNKGAVDLLNYYSVRGTTRNMQTRQYYFCELKEQGTNCGEMDTWKRKQQ